MSFRRSVVILRKEGYYDESDKYITNDSNTLKILATVQPISLDEYTKIFPEGTNTNNAVKIYTDTKLLTDKSTSEQNADVLLYMGEKYKIIACHAYQNGLINHYKAYAQEITDE